MTMLPVLTIRLSEKLTQMNSA